jgi:hypothetical protein
LVRRFLFAIFPGAIMHRFKWGPGALMHFAPDTGNGGGTGQAPNNDNPTSDVAPGAQAQDKDRATPATGTAGKVDELPEWAQREIRDLRKENGDRRKAEQSAAEAARKAEEDRMAQQNEWRELAQKRLERITELEPQATQQAERLTRMEAMLLGQLEAEIKDWPAELKQLDPGKDADLLSRFDWLQKSRALAQKLITRTPAPGNGARPLPAGVKVGKEGITSPVDKGSIF